MSSQDAHTHTARFVTHLFFAAIVVFIVLPVALNAATCESLLSLSRPGVAVTKAQRVSGGTFVPETPISPPLRDPSSLNGLPSFCRIAALLEPAIDSSIKIEVWLPIEGWNGKYQAVGNGGWAGSINHGAMGQALKRGYATSSTDTGHTGNTGSEVLSHPQKLIDFAERAVHEMSVHSKVIIDAFYGNAPQISYFNGCSSGGRQSLKEAQVYPGDFQGIIAGAPAIDQIRSAPGKMWIAHAVSKSPASYIPATKYPAIHNAVIAACDAKDGLKDGLIDNPTMCKFDPVVLACKDGDNASCLTSAQIDAARKILSPINDARTGKEAVPRMEPGSELGWAVQAGGEPYASSLDLLKYVVFKQPNWDWRTFNFTDHMDLINKASTPIQANSTDLNAFVAKSGKLLMYHGWSDENIPPSLTVKYYGNVLDKMGGEEKTKDWLRLFMAPGMAHCGGGDGPNQFDSVTAIENWVEKGIAPDQLIASHVTGGKVDRTRPLCSYPKVAKYKGTGSIDDAANFVCKLP